MNENKVICGDALLELKKLESESVDCCITSPPYWNLRDYNVPGQLGLEPTFQEYISKLCDIFNEVKRVLKKEGTCFVNLGDTYSGNKEGKTDNKVSETNIHKKAVITEKSLCQIPSRFAIKMAERGWILRNEIIWYKPNAMPSSAEDRFSVDFEKVFFFVKSKRYYFEQQFEKSLYFETDKRAITGPSKGGKAMSGNYSINKGGAFRKDGMKNKRCVWKVNTHGYSEAHFATFPENLVSPMIKAGCPKEVCKKCGKARERIIERVDAEIQRPRKFGKVGNNDRNDTGNIYREKVSKEIGLTDCGCGVGFSGGIVLDCFFGAGTTGVVAKKLQRNYIGIDISKDYCEIARKRLQVINPMF